MKRAWPNKSLRFSSDGSLKIVRDQCPRLGALVIGIGRRMEVRGFSHRRKHRRGFPGRTLRAPVLSRRSATAGNGGISSAGAKTNRVFVAFRFDLLIL